MIKADALALDENNAILWARKIFKTKPNKHIPENLKTTIKTIFHHLTKEELIEKIIADHLGQTNLATPKSEVQKKK